MGAAVIHASLLNDDWGFEYYRICPIPGYLSWGPLRNPVLVCHEWKRLRSCISRLVDGYMDGMDYHCQGQWAHGTVYHAHVQPVRTLRIFALPKGSG